jgi:hypothetical protein
MRALIFLLFILIFLTSCVTSKKYTSFVNEKLETKQIDSTIDREWLIINTNQLKLNGNECRKVKSSFIPAIIYWEWNTAISCDIDQSLTVNYLKDAIYKAADSLNLIENLKKYKLIINIKSVPGQFLYEDKESVLFLIVAYIVSGGETILPTPIDFVADYEIQSENNMMLKGEIIIKNNEQPMKNIWKSTKKFTGMYLDHYKKETEKIGLELITEIIKKIENK